MTASASLIFLADRSLFLPELDKQSKKLCLCASARTPLGEPQLASPVLSVVFLSFQLRFWCFSSSSSHLPSCCGLPAAACHEDVGDAVNNQFLRKLWPVLSDLAP